MRMAAVPTGPGSGSRAEMSPYRGTGGSVPGDQENRENRENQENRENRGLKLQDALRADVGGIGQKADVSGCKVEDYRLSQLNLQCEAFERRINRLHYNGVSDFIHNHDDAESLNGLKANVDHCDISSCGPNTNSTEHKLNSDTSIVTLSRTEPGQSPANDLDDKITECYLRTDEGHEVTSQTRAAADGLVLEMCRLDLNHSSAAEVNQSPDVVYVHYESELQMPGIMRLITKDLSEPYSIYTYRYFIHNWPQLCFLAMVQEVCVGAIVCKLDMHKKMFRRGYIAMLAVDSKHRRKNIGTNLVKKAIYAMVEGDCDEVVLETEITNKSALMLYENLGFVRDKRLFRYYLNGVDALRLKLWLR